MDDGKQEIIKRFNNNVRGKKPDTSIGNQNHDGKSGHWLERQMGIGVNNRTEADLFGYEMKNQTTSGKTTFGDWSADYYIFKDPKYFTSRANGINKDRFMRIFGSYKPEKVRYSWSGEVTPKVNNFNRYGQKLVVGNNRDIFAVYNYDQDLRVDKVNIIESNMQTNDLILAQWKHESMKKRVESKFNNKGWFRCLQNDLGVYDAIQFGKPITFEDWIALVEKGVVFFDSGMKQEESRNYSLWRASNSFWTSLIIDSH